MKTLRIALTDAQREALAPIIAAARVALTPDSLFAEVRRPTWPNDPSEMYIDIVSLPKICADKVRKVVDAHCSSQATTDTSNQPSASNSKL